MKKIKLSTKTGYRWALSANNNEGYKLSDIYERYSFRKENAYNWCFDQFRKSEFSKNFRIISHNTFNFSVAWEDVIDGEEVTRIETANNSYAVLLNR